MQCSYIARFTELDGYCVPELKPVNPINLHIHPDVDDCASLKIQAPYSYQYWELLKRLSNISGYLILYFCPSTINFVCSVYSQLLVMWEIFDELEFVKLFPV